MSYLHRQLSEWCVVALVSQSLGHGGQLILQNSERGPLFGAVGPALLHYLQITAQELANIYFSRTNSQTHVVNLLSTRFWFL